MKTFLVTLMLAVALVGCSKDFRSMKVSEVDALPEAERRELAKTICTGGEEGGESVVRSFE